jgi:hypothetical protein
MVSLFLNLSCGRSHLTEIWVLSCIFQSDNKYQIGLQWLTIWLDWKENIHVFFSCYKSNNKYVFVTNFKCSSSKSEVSLKTNE